MTQGQTLHTYHTYSCICSLCISNFQGEKFSPPLHCSLKRPKKAFSIQQVPEPSFPGGPIQIKGPDSTWGRRSRGRRLSPTHGCLSHITGWNVPTRGHVSWDKRGGPCSRRHRHLLGTSGGARVRSVPAMPGQTPGRGEGEGERDKRRRRREE